MILLIRISFKAVYRITIKELRFFTVSDIAYYCVDHNLCENKLKNNDRYICAVMIDANQHQYNLILTGNVIVFLLNVQ